MQKSAKATEFTNGYYLCRVLRKLGIMHRHSDDINALPNVLVGGVSLLPELLKESRAMNTSEAYRRGFKSHPRPTSIGMEHGCL
ncbi:hypothetical protein DPMN_049139 [Dreissena polymorpha]|uniref:Uncharacterized protein n=1 Tax=Dreissena polymorpha TaxID=45954 RepID=A0A9D4DC09_DREPO|nr:hypothetical protein DPMN_049139 [Dreissena polymorpha]